MKTLKRYWNVYKSFLKINAKQVVAYRMDTIIGGLLASTVWTFLTIVSMYLLTLKIDNAFGWTRNELIMLACAYNMAVGFFSLLFMRAFQELPMIINRGWLDMYLLKPIDSQFSITSHSISLISTIRGFMGIIITIIAVHILDISVSPIEIISFMVLLVFGGLLLYSTLYILCTLLIWFPQLDNITDVFYTLRAMGRFPGGMYRANSEFLFILFSPFIIPIAIPTRALLGNITSGELFHLIGLSVAMFIASRVFWKYALRHYTSASG